MLPCHLGNAEGPYVYFGRFKGKEVTAVAEGHLGHVSCAALLWGRPSDNSYQGSQIRNAEHGLKDIVMKAGPNEYKFKGQPYVTGFVLPNVYFHVTTAYAILRDCGVELGKKDYLGI